MSTAYANNNKLPSDLARLQNLINRDKESYVEEFSTQHSLYEATKVIFEQDPTVYNGPLLDLVKFFAHIAQLYPEELRQFPEELVSILERHGSTLHPEMRMGLVKALVQLRNKNLLSPTELLQLFFNLLRSQDKELRSFLQQHIIMDIKNINSKSKNGKLNRELQNFMYDMLKNNHAVAIKTSVDIMIELYKKHVWNDAKTVNIIASACFNKIPKVMVAAVKFFVGVDVNDAESESDSDSDEEAPNMQQIAHNLKVSKSKKSKQKQLEKAKAALRKEKKKNRTKAAFDFSAIHLIHDPQSLAEKLYQKLEKTNQRFEVKLMLMNFISRLIGLHELYLPNFYAYLQRYLFVGQRDFTKIMVFSAQAAHEHTPPDDILPILKTLANNFVTERYSGEVMAIGINAIRELCARNPFGMDEDLLHDLTSYRTSKDKAVSVAAKSLIQLFREKNPALLMRKHRSAPTELTAEMKVREFGDVNAKSFIPGAELVEYLPDNDNSMEFDTDTSDSDSDNEVVDGGSSKKAAMNQVMKLTVEERSKMAADVVTSRLLSNEDFKRIEELQAAKQFERFSASRKKVAKRKLEETIAESDLVKLSNIERIESKRRHDKDSRLQSMMEGREGREKFGSRKGRLDPYASKTNRERNKAKNFQMVKHKLFASKQRKSFREKQANLKKSLLRQLKN